jgi:inhibitor of cysteine peptidase
MGDRLYMVTFRQIDPFFVIDLSNPLQPEVLGELKIPGFSTYLHPYDENHIIGVGQDTKENEWGGVTTKGVKLALFDVSDVANPRQLDQFVIGEEGTYSEALYDHKAFLFSKDLNLVVLPVREVLGKPYFDENLRYYREKVWQGAYVLSLDTEEGFGLKGKVTHAQDDEDQNSWYGTPSAVRRSLYMDDTLYTISDSKIVANDLSDVREISSVKLPYEKPDYGYPYPVLYSKGSSGAAEGVAVSEPAVAQDAPVAME